MKKYGWTRRGIKTNDPTMQIKTPVMPPSVCARV